MARAAAVALGSAETLLARSQQRAWTRLAAGNVRNIGSVEFYRLVEAFGFRLRRVTGGHYIYRHSDVPRPSSLRPAGGSKPCQIPQFLEMVEEHCLKMERRR
jgi:hypothetical protein